MEHTQSIPKRIVAALDWLIDRAIMIAFLIAILIGIYYTYDAYHVYHGANDTSILKYKPQTPEQAAEYLGELSKDAIAWLTLDDTNIDFPIMQGETNEKYLNMDPYGNFSLSGSIFLDSRNKPDFSDPYSLTYGHHMNRGYMFGDLDKFLEKNYFDSHRTGTLILNDGTVYDVHIFAAITTQTDVPEVFAPTENAGPLDYVRYNAEIFEEPPEGVRLLGFSTCKTPDSIDRTFVLSYITLKD